MTTKMKERTASFQMYLSAVFALFAAINMGCVIGWSGIALESLRKPESRPQIRTYRNGTDILVVPDDLPYEDWIRNCVSLGGLLGSLTAGVIIYLIGRRKTLIALGLPMLAGWICICFAKNFALIIFGRCLTGFSAGIISVVTPGYVYDIATPGTKGFLGTCFQIAIVLGELYEVCFGSALEWNQLPYATFMPSIVCSAGMWWFAPESPIRLVEAGDEFSLQQAREVLHLIRARDSDVEAELEELQHRVQTTKEHNNYSHSFLKFAIIKRPDVYHPAIISVMLMAFQQFSGVNAFLFYLKTIFEGVNVNVNSNVAIIILNGAMIAATIHTALIMDKFGRKMMLLISGIGQVVALTLMGYYYMAITPNDGWIPVACLLLFVVMYSLGFGPIPWMMGAEIAPNEAGPLVESLVSVTNWLLVFFITQNVQPLNDYLHKYGQYWLYAGCSILAVLYTLFFVPETKDRSIEEIQQYFINK